MKNQVLIIGSGKSESIKLEFEQIVFASNSSIYRLDKNFDTNIIHVASTNILDSNLIKEEKSQHLKLRRNSLIDRKPKELIIYPNFKNPEILKYNFKELNYCPKKISYVSKKQFWSYIVNEVGFTTIKYSLTKDKGVVYNFLRLIKHIIGYSINPIFLPSTGIFALLIAISRYKKNVEYVLNGVGLLNDQGTRTFYYEKLKMTSNTEIVHTDNIILKILKQKYKINIID